MNFSVVPLYNPGIIIGKLPDDLFAKVKIALDSPEARETSSRDKLVGTIKEEYYTPEIPGFTDFINTTFNVWTKTFRVSVPSKYNIGPIWTNFMKKTDFNPLHNHNGSLVSFVVWVKIPYDLKTEMAHNDYDNSVFPSMTASFQFVYTTLTGTIRTLPLYTDKSFEGTIIMFPSNLNHTVYPFYSSDDERISIAGNISSMESMYQY